MGVGSAILSVCSLSKVEQEVVRCGRVLPAGDFDSVRSGDEWCEIACCGDSARQGLIEFVVGGIAPYVIDPTLSVTVARNRGTAVERAAGMNGRDWLSALHDERFNRQSAA